jgi:uncharacterized protein YlbG (UPF0298 family)
VLMQRLQQFMFRVHYVSKKMIFALIFCSCLIKTLVTELRHIV